MCEIANDRRRASGERDDIIDEHAVVPDVVGSLAEPAALLSRTFSVSQTWSKSLLKGIMTAIRWSAGQDERSRCDGPRTGAAPRMA